jgi:hypothetical protein
MRFDIISERKRENPSATSFTALGLLGRKNFEEDPLKSMAEQLIGWSSRVIR